MVCEFRGLPYVRDFDLSPLAVLRSMIHPVHGFLAFRKRQCIFPASERPRLEALESINHDSEKVFLVASVDALFLDGAILKTDLEGVDDAARVALEVGR